MGSRLASTTGPGTVRGSRNRQAAGCLAAFWAIGRWVPGAAKYLGESAVGGSVGRSQRVLDEIARFEHDLERILGNLAD